MKTLNTAARKAGIALRKLMKEKVRDYKETIAQPLSAIKALRDTALQSLKSSTEMKSYNTNMRKAKAAYILFRKKHNLNYMDMHKIVPVGCYRLRSRTMFREFNMGI